MKKRFHHNGKYVCDYDSTGEPLKDIHIIHRLMAEHGVATTDVSPEQVIFPSSQFVYRNISLSF
jgi:hypothetical protein